MNAHRCWAPEIRLVSWLILAFGLGAFAFRDDRLWLAVFFHLALASLFIFAYLTGIALKRINQHVRALDWADPDGELGEEDE